MSEERCPSCLMADFETLIAACAFCGIRGCDPCIYDGDAMYNAPTCCAEAKALHEAWWTLPAAERFRYHRGASAEEMTRDEALALLDKLTGLANVRAALPAGETATEAEICEFLSARGAKLGAEAPW